MRFRVVPLAAMSAAALVLLSACTFSATANVTTSASKVAKTAEDALEKKVGSRPDVDCGDKDIKVVKGKSITCELTDPEDGSVYDVTVTFTSVKGLSYHIDVQVADTPKSGPTNVPSDPSAPSATVPEADFAALAAGALAPKLGFTPDISCPDDPVTIEAGHVETCTFTDDKGDDHDVSVTVTDFDGSNYDIDALVLS